MTNLSDKYKDSLPFESSNVTTIVSNYTASNNETVFVNTASSALTVTLPTSPTQGSKIKVLDIATNSQNNNITVLGNGNNIGGASAYIINTPDSSVEVMYINANKGWNILNQYVSLAKPGTPTSISAVDVGTGRDYNNGAATVSFVAPISGGAVDSYTVTSTPENYTASGVSSPIIVTGLQSNTSYTFTVSASNSSGTTVSNSSDSIIATTVPQAPTISTIDYGFERLLVNYTAGANGGKAVSAFTATRTGGVTGSGSSPIAFNSLTGGTTYEVTMTATNENGTSVPSAAQSQTPFTASGGTITTSGAYRIHSFTESSTFILSGNSSTCDYLIVAGGGGGAAPHGGGGGAGGYRTDSVSIAPQTYNVVVGGGGGGGGNGGNGSNGQSSSIFGIESLGGGGGGTVFQNGLNGGSGGGAGFQRSPGNGSVGQGNNGGFSYGVSDSARGGGGGGAGAVGVSSNFNGNAGGAGLESNISGSFVYRAGGGGGGGQDGGGGSAGIGGGASGTPSNTRPANATSGLGGGGGGGGGGAGGSNGGSGIVIVRYLV